MQADELRSLTDEVLQNRLKGKKTLMWVFVPIIFGLLYFIVDGFLKGKGFDLPIVIIVITSIGGLVSLFPEFAAIQKEIIRRSEKGSGPTK